MATSLSILISLAILTLVVFISLSTEVESKNKHEINLRYAKNGGIRVKQEKHRRAKTTKPKRKVKPRTKEKVKVTKTKVKPEHSAVTIKNGHLMHNNQKIFLSGTNIAWKNYARDFGSGAYSGVKSQYETWMSQVSAAGGNTIRVWLHTDGQWSPKFDSQGLATGEDTASLIAELTQLLTYAEKHNTFIILCLWNTAVSITPPLTGMFADESKLDSYIAKVLKPMVLGLKNKKALLAYDILNEGEGAMTTGLQDSNPCYDTQIIVGSGANWALTNLTAKSIQKFINIQADAIKSVHPTAMITLGSSEKYSSNACDKCRNYWSDSCLRSAGGKQKGVLDFYQFHSYIWEGKYSEMSPMKKVSNDYRLDKPILIGEMSTVCSEILNASYNYRHAYNSNYCGILNWQYNEGGHCSDNRTLSDAAMQSIRNMINKGHVKIKI